MAKDKLLEVQNLTVAFRAGEKSVPVVKGVSLEVPKDSWVCLVGESGSGKTLTALSLTQLIPQAGISGRVLWHGDEGAQDLLALSGAGLQAVRGKHISYIFQDPHSSLNPVMTIGEQMVETYTAHFHNKKHESEKAAMISLAEARLTEPRRVFESYPHELSGGMKQRVMIAMALLTGPELLVADEPTTSLDVTTESGILELLRDIRSEWSLSCLFITHNIWLASQIADTIYVMKEGCIVETLPRVSGEFVPREGYSRTLFNAGLQNVKPKTKIEV